MMKGPIIDNLIELYNMVDNNLLRLNVTPDNTHYITNNDRHIIITDILFHTILDDTTIGFNFYKSDLEIIN